MTRVTRYNTYVTQLDLATGGGTPPPVVVGPTFTGAGTSLGVATSTAANVPVPSGVTGGLQQAVLVALYQVGTATVTPPAGFVEAPNSPWTVTGTQPYRGHLFYHRPTGVETGTYNFTLGTSVSRSGVAFLYDGLVSSGIQNSPFDITTSAVKAATTDATVPAVSLITTQDGTRLIHLVMQSQSRTTTPPSGFTEQAELGTISIELSDMAQLVAGDTGTISSAVLSGNSSSSAFLGALTDTGPPQFGSVGTELTSASAASPANVAVPAGVVADEVILVFWYQESTAAVTGPTGFTEAVDSPVIVGPDFYLRVFWKRATGVDSGTYAFTYPGTVYRNAVAMRFTGCITTGDPFDVTVSAVDTSSGDGITPPISDNTRGADREWVWVAASFNGGNCSTVAGFTERFDAGSQFVVDTKDQQLTGPSGSLTGTFTSAGSGGAWLGALLPSRGGGEPPPPPPPVPTITSISPSSGSAGPVTINGTNFISGASVSFGGLAATSVTVVNATQITCTAPAHANGAVNVIVTTSAGTSTAFQWTYVTTAGTLISTFAQLTRDFTPNPHNPAQTGGDFTGSGGGHISNVSTPYGQGWEMVVNGIDQTPWDPQLKCMLNGKDLSGQLGQTGRWSFQMFIPTQTLAVTHHAGLLFEFHTGSSSGHYFGLYNNPDHPNSIQIGRQNGVNFTYDITYGIPIPWDHWCPVIIDIKWSAGSDGFVKWNIDGVERLNFTGQTWFNDGEPTVQWGWYSRIIDSSLSHKVTFGDVRFP